MGEVCVESESSTDKCWTTAVKVTGPPGKAIKPRSIVTVDIQHKAYFLIQLNAKFPLSLCLLIPLLALLAYSDADYPDANPD